MNRPLQPYPALSATMAFSPKTAGIGRAPPTAFQAGRRKTPSTLTQVKELTGGRRHSAYRRRRSHRLASRVAPSCGADIAGGGNEKVQGV